MYLDVDSSFSSLFVDLITYPTIFSNSPMISKDRISSYSINWKGKTLYS